MRLITMAIAASLLGGCVIHHSKQALWPDLGNVPAADATFETEEDSGVSLLGIIQLAEPDHYAVLLERVRRRYQCARMHNVQLDFYTDHWLLIAFPISRVTLICDRSMAPPIEQPPADEALPPQALEDDASEEVTDTEEEAL